MTGTGDTTGVSPALAPVVLELISSSCGAELESGKMVNKEAVIHYMNKYRREENKTKHTERKKKGK